MAKFSEYLTTLIATIKDNNTLVGTLSVLSAAQRDLEDESNMPGLLAPAASDLINFWKSGTVSVADIQAQFQALIAVPGMLDYIVQDAALVELLANAIYSIPAIFNTLEPSVKTSVYLAYLFSVERTEAELTLGKKAVEVVHDPMTLVTEVNDRYADKLLALKDKTETTELDRKRIKRIVEFLQQLSYEQRQDLSQIPVVPLFMLHAQIQSYGHKTEKAGGILRSIKSVALGGSKKDQKTTFIVMLKEDLEQKSLGAKKAQETLFPLIWRIFDVIQNGFVTAHIEGTEYVSGWLREEILHGKETANTLTWLPEAYLTEILTEKFAGVDLVVRQLQCGPAMATDVTVADIIRLAFPAAEVMVVERKPFAEDKDSVESVPEVQRSEDGKKTEAVYVELETGGRKKSGRFNLFPSFGDKEKESVAVASDVSHVHAETGEDGFRHSGENDSITPAQETGCRLVEDEGAIDSAKEKGNKKWQIPGLSAWRSSAATAKEGDAGPKETKKSVFSFGGSK